MCIVEEVVLRGYRASPACVRTPRFGSLAEIGTAGLSLGNHGYLVIYNIDDHLRPTLDTRSHLLNCMLVHLSATSSICSSRSGL